MTATGEKEGKEGGSGVACPRCGKRAAWHGNPWRPFCSQRCKEIDLAAWADESYRLPSEDSPPSDDEER